MVAIKWLVHLQMPAVISVMIMIHPTELLVALLSVWISASAKDIRYVLPNGSSPQSCPGPPCLTIDQYTQQAETYFTTGSTFVFLAGNHSLQTTLTLSGISDVTLRGSEENASLVNIICMNDVIQSSSVTKLTIEHSTFLLRSKCKPNVRSSGHHFK